MRVWERGAGETQACGTGACAAVVAGVRRGLVGRECKVILDGGDLFFKWDENSGHITMTGEVHYVFEGRLL
jgi:diaminopimelate epimerase